MASNSVAWLKEAWTAASTRNFTYTKGLGANMVFDYKSPPVPEGITVYGITVYGIFGTTLKDNAVSKATYEDFLPKALAAGTFKPVPAPLVVYPPPRPLSSFR